MTEKERFLESIKEPEYVIVSDEMVAAGLDRLSELPRDKDDADVVREIYMAMEYERRAFERNKKRSDEIERSVNERRERLRTATRGPKKKFRL